MKRHPNLIWLVIITAVFAVGAYWHQRHLPAKVQPATQTSSSSRATASQPAPTPSFNKQQRSINDAASLWVVVDKLRPLQPTSYVPANLVTPNVPLRLAKGNEEMLVRGDAAAALETMFAAAKTDGANLLIASGYRSEAFQQALYARYVSEQGMAAADTSSARAGYSEHQTGLAIDVGRTDHHCEVDPCFADTTEGQWIAQHAYQYGFVIRYPQNKQSITGYEYEPWHLRYVGTDLAKAIRDSGQTMEEFFGLPAAPDYKH